MFTLKPPSLAIAKHVGRTALWLGAALVLAACSALPHKPAPIARYDFGLPTPAASNAAPLAATSTRAPLVMAKVGTSGGADASTAIVYRLAYANDRELHPYTQARWGAPAALLIQQRMRDTLSRQRAVLMDDDGATQALVPASLPAMLRLEVDEFSQVFDSASTSRGLVRLRATLTELTPKGEKWLGQQVFEVSEHSPTADAAGGTTALAAASAQAAQQVDAWLRQLGR